MPVVILGMHRSGTSLTAHCLARMGVNMGDELLPADDSNPDGHFEDVDFLELNKRILASAGGVWSFPQKRKQLRRLERLYGQAILDLIKQKQAVNRGRLWGWKDPRNCMTIPMYHARLDNPRYIVVRRQTADIVRSLRKRNGRGTGHAGNWAQLARHYHGHIDAFIQHDAPRYLEIKFERLVSELHAPDELWKIANFLGIKERRANNALKIIRFR